MMIFKQVIPRRTLLRGMGAALALPLLEAMVPAFATAAGKAPVRLATVYVPNGMWPMDKWTPKTEGAGFELTPTLEPLAPFRDQLLVLSGLSHKEANASGGPHTLAFATFLTGVRPEPTSGKDYRLGISMDQLAAEKLGKETQLASLEVSLFQRDLGSNCEGNTCAYFNTLSWRTPTTPLPTERNPRALFERLFGDSDNTDRGTRLARIREQRSILDGVSKLASRFLAEIGPTDGAKLTEYLDAIRDIERRIQLAEQQADREVPVAERPAGAPASFEEYAKLMIDLQVLAYQADLTRVITFVMEKEGGGGRAYPEIGIPDEHHILSHHQGGAVAIDKLFRIHVFHMKLFAYFLSKLRSVPDGDGNLLDNTILLYGSGLSDGNAHLHKNLPILLVGGAGGGPKGGRHIRYPDGTAMTNLQLTILDKLGVPVEKLGDSTGKLDLLSV